VFHSLTGWRSDCPACISTIEQLASAHAAAPPEPSSCAVLAWPDDEGDVLMRITGGSGLIWLDHRDARKLRDALDGALKLRDNQAMPGAVQP
jgi:hypothetical protein